MTEQYYQDLTEHRMAVGDPHPAFEAIDEMRALPLSCWSQFIGYAMMKNRCDLVRHWLVSGAEPDSLVWLDALSLNYSVAMLDVLPLLLDVRPLSLIAIQRLLKHSEARPYLANYLYAFSAEELVVNDDVDILVFLDDYFDLSAPIVLATAIEMGGVRKANAIKFLYDRCSDLEYKSLKTPCLSINEHLAVRLLGNCLQADAQFVMAAVPERFHVTVGRLLHLRSEPVALLVDPMESDCWARLLDVDGPPLARLMGESLATFIGWFDGRRPLEIFENHRDSPNYPLTWLLIHHPEQATEERIASATRSELVCAAIARSRVSPHLRGLVYARLA